MSASHPEEFWPCQGAFWFSWVTFYVVPRNTGLSSDYKMCIQS